MRTPLPEKSPEHTDYLDLVKKQNMIIDYLKEREEVPSMRDITSPDLEPTPPVTTIKERVKEVVRFHDGDRDLLDDIMFQINLAVSEAQDQRTAEIREMLKPLVERIRLDVNVIVCDCGERYKDSDLDLSVGELEALLTSLGNKSV